MGNIDMRGLALNLLAQSPAISQSPMGQQFLHILQTNDVQAGEQMALNICNSYGSNPNDMLLKATRFFQGK